MGEGEQDQPPERTPWSERAAQAWMTVRTSLASLAARTPGGASMGPRQGSVPPSTLQEWREQSNAYRATYLEGTRNVRPSAADARTGPPRRAVSLLLLAATAFFFVLCAAMGLIVLLPSGAPSSAGPVATTMPVRTHTTATSLPSGVLPDVTFTTMTPGIVEPVGGQGFPYVTATPTGQPAATASTTPSGPPGTPVTGTPGATAPTGPPAVLP